MFGCVALAPSGSIGNGMRELFRFVPDTRFLIPVPKRPEVRCTETILALDVRKIQIVEINVSWLPQQSSIAALSWSGSFFHAELYLRLVHAFAVWIQEGWLEPTRYRKIEYLYEPRRETLGAPAA